MRTVSPELAILDESGFEASLGEVARSAMPLRVPVGVTGDEVLHAPRQVGLGRTEEKWAVTGRESNARVGPNWKPTWAKEAARRRPRPPG